MFSYAATSLETEQFGSAPPSMANTNDPTPAVSIIVPTLNEAESIDKILGDIIENVRGYHDFEIIVADGGSTDGTCEKVAHWRTLYPVVLVNGDGGGLAEDVLSAAARATFPILVVLDADGSHPASSIVDLVRPVASGQYDMAIGSRYVEGGRTVGWPFRRRALSRLGAAFAAPFTDIADPLSGFFAMRRECLLATGAEARGFKIGLEAIFAGGDGLRVSEVPISFTDRVRGTSKIGAGQFAAYLMQLLRFSRGVHSSNAIRRFLAVGMAGFFVDFAVVCAMLAFGADLTVAHISGFCIATAFNYVCHALWSFEGRPGGNTRIVRFLLLSALALAMRGGFIATASGPLDLPFFLAVLTGIIGGGVVSYVGNEFYVFRSNALLSPAAQWRLAAMAVAAYVVVLRIAYQGNIDLIPQEAYYWNYAQHLAWGYLDHPPMVAWLVWLGTSLMGDTEFGVRMGASLSWLATAFFAFRLAHNLFGRTQAFLAVLLLSILPFFFGIGLVMTPDAPLTAAWAGALYFLERAIIGNRHRAWLGAGVCVGLGMLSKYTIALLGPATIVLLIVHPQSRRWFRTKWPYLCAGLAGILFSPVVAWNADNAWASFVFQGSRRWLAEDIRFSTPTLFVFIAMVLGPVGLSLANAAIGKRIRLPGGLDARAPMAFVAVFTFVPLCVFVAFSVFHTVKLNWTGPVWLALLPAMANVVATAVRDRRMPFLLAGLKAGAAASILLFALLLHYLALGLPFTGYSGSLRGLPTAWEEFAAQAEQIKAEVAAETGHSPLLVGMDAYNIASELRFYSKGRTALDAITSQNLVGRNGLMFGVWSSDLPAERSVVVMYSLKESNLAGDDLADWFATIGPVERHVVRKNGAVAGRFFYRVGHGLRQPN